MRCAIKSNKITFIKKSLILIPLIILSLTLSCQDISAQPISRARPQAEEVDTSPSGYYWKYIYPNTSLTANADGTLSIDFVGGSLPTTYLKLDASNDPLTGDLSLRNIYFTANETYDIGSLAGYVRDIYSGRYVNTDDTYFKVGSADGGSDALDFSVYSTTAGKYITFNGRTGAPTLTVMADTGIGATPAYLFDLTLAADDTRAIYIDGSTTDYTTSATGITLEMIRDLNVGTGNLANYAGIQNNVCPKHTNANVNGTQYTYGIINKVNDDSTMTNNLVAPFTYQYQYGSYNHLDNDSAMDTSNTGENWFNWVGLYSRVDGNPTISDTSAGGNNCQGIALGADIDVNWNANLVSGNVLVQAVGLRIDVDGATEGGSSTSVARAIQIAGSSGCDSNWGIVDLSGADWQLDGDSQKIYWGEWQDGYVEHDGDSLNIVGNSNAATDDIILDANTVVIGDDGGATNYAQFADDGEFTLAGTARVIKTRWFPFNALKEPGTKPATFKEWGISGVWEFSDADDDTIVFNLQVPSDMDKTVAPSFDIGWSTNTTVTTETAVWQLEYLYTAPGEDTTAAAQETLTVNSNAIAQANGFITAEITGIDLPGATDACIHCRLKRLGADGADDLTDTAELHGICIKYTSDKLGETL